MGRAARLEGIHAIPWNQTELDGIAAPDLADLAGGMVWRWSGQAVCLDGPQAVLRLSQPSGGVNRLRVRNSAARLLASIDAELLAAGVETLNDRPAPAAPDSDIDEDHDANSAPRFWVTDGRRLYAARLVSDPCRRAPLVVFHDCLPPADTDLYLTETRGRFAIASPEAGRGIVCFAPGTLLRTPDGARAVETLEPGDLVSTRDDGAQPVEWSGRSHISAARLRALPDLRPIRMRYDALGDGRPEPDLILSPDHRLLLGGPAAQALFSEPEVLVSAGDLVNDGPIHRDHSLREVDYVHILLPRHGLIWANGVPCESLHPADMDLDRLDAPVRDSLLTARPDLAAATRGYGPHARRCLGRAEAALLFHAAGLDD